MKPLIRESEPYSRYGNMSAEGIQKLLGAPHMDRLQTLIRESVQNSWDARLDNAQPVYEVVIKNLTADEKHCLEKTVLNDLPDEGGKNNPVRESFKRNKLRVIILSDYGTSGLGGPTRPDEIPLKYECPDFADFMRNIGSPRDTPHGGGTYGYGKSSLFSMSHCQTLIINTLTKYKGEQVRRFMGVRVGQRYDVKGREQSGRYTGRHWWGLPDTEGRIEPVTGSNALTLSNAIGMPKRKDTDYGTSIMIIDPELGSMSPEDELRSVLRALLWNFWPKMLTHGNEPPAMGFKLKIDGRECTIPDVIDCPPLDLFAEAMFELKKDTDNVINIQSGNPRKHLGKLAIRRDLKGFRHELFSDSDNYLPNPCCHVALMRPAELVIKYLEGQPLPNDRTEWAGVFICDDDVDVEKAFAEAEPPAHDDWDPSFLPKGTHRTFVNVALRNIRKHMIQYINPVQQTASDENRESLGMLGVELGKVLSGIEGQSAGEGDQVVVSSGKNGKRPRKMNISQPVYKGVRLYKGMTCAEYVISLKSSSHLEMELVGKPRILVDGGGTVTETPDGTEPEIVAWQDKSGKIIGKGSILKTQFDKEVTISALVMIPGFSAISFSVKPEIVS